MWEVVVRRSVRPVIDDLKGKRTGYANTYAQLERDPCLIHPPVGGESEGRPFAYRLSGPLDDKVCGVWLNRGYRLAFSMRASGDPDVDGVVEILYAGPRDTRDREADVWKIVHDLFEEENPPDEHLRPPCCADGLPDIDEDELREFMDRLRRLTRGR